MATRTLRAAAVLFFSLFLTQAQAEFKEGVHYERILTPVPTTDPAKVEVVELFWYGCPHCYQFEPYIARWLEKKPEDVDFVKLPATLRKEWVNHARAYFVADTLGIVDKIHTPLFEQIHQANQPTDTEDALAAFFATHGVEEAKFRELFSSFGVQARVQQADKKARAYRASGVPTLIVNGKYRVQVQKDVFEVVNHLVDLERAALADKTP